MSVLTDPCQLALNLTKDRGMRQLLHVDLRLLLILRTIVESKGLARAQNALNMSQSTVSASLAELEERLGLRLCNRGRSGFELTEAGRIVYEASHDLFDAVNRFSASTNAISDATKGILRIGAVDAIATNSMLPLAHSLRRFKSHAKNVLVDFLNAGPEELESQLLQGKRDIILGPYGERYATLNYVPLHQERQSLYCGQYHKLFNKIETITNAADLGGLPFVARRYLHSADLMRVGLSDPQAVVDTMEAQLILIQSGEYFGYLPEHYAKAWVDTGELRVIRPGDFSYDSHFYAVFMKQRIPNQLIKRFIGLLLEDCLRESGQAPLTKSAALRSSPVLR
jgi:LysR family transcriptional regulator, transcriptional activator for bauABCD operon